MVSRLDSKFGSCGQVEFKESGDGNCWVAGVSELRADTCDHNPPFEQAEEEGLTVGLSRGVQGGRSNVVGHRLGCSEDGPEAAMEGETAGSEDTNQKTRRTSGEG